jgi:Domain of unknown function (DUF4263)
MGYRLRISVEDRFVVLALREEHAMLPEQETIASILAALFSVDPQLQIVCDLRGVRTIYNDVSEAVEVLVDHGAQLLGSDQDVRLLNREFGTKINALAVADQIVPLRFAPLALLPFEDFDHYLVRERDWESLSRDLSYDLPTDEDWEYVVAHDTIVRDMFNGLSDLRFHWNATSPKHRLNPSVPGGLQVLQRRYLRQFIDTNARRSLLSHFTLTSVGETVHVRPYHAAALNTIEVRNETLIGRPGVFARRTRELLEPELSEFEELIRGSRTKERDIQRFLELHPAIFQRMGYQHVYSQVILEREDGTSLRPDFILEPLGRPWCDILDLKLPASSIVVGRRDRKTLASAVHELIAQLREYAAYFEDERLSKRVEEAYGIRCYRPRLIGVIGRDPNLADERQKRRMMTAYQDVSVVTFDELARIAKSRLLI